MEVKSGKFYINNSSGSVVIATEDSPTAKSCFAGVVVIWGGCYNRIYNCGMCHDQKQHFLGEHRDNWYKEGFQPYHNPFKPRQLYPITNMQVLDSEHEFMSLMEYRRLQRKSIENISRILQVPEQELRKYLDDIHMYHFTDEEKEASWAKLISTLRSIETV
jgi:hypothetical protein